MMTVLMWTLFLSKSGLDSENWDRSTCCPSKFGVRISAMITLWDWCKEDLSWWYTYLPVFSGNELIPVLDYSLPLYALQGFKDAAGGSLEKWGNVIEYFLPLLLAVCCFKNKCAWFL